MSETGIPVYINLGKGHRSRGTDGDTGGKSSLLRGWCGRAFTRENHASRDRTSLLWRRSHDHAGLPKKLGTGFHRCFDQRRLIAVKTLIAEGILPEAVGEQAGFSDYSTFYRACKKEYGVSPRQYRKLQESNGRP